MRRQLAISWQFHQHWMAGTILRFCPTILNPDQFPRNYQGAMDATLPGKSFCFLAVGLYYYWRSAKEPATMHSLKDYLAQPEGLSHTT